MKSMTDARTHVYAARLATFGKIAALFLMTTVAALLALPAHAQSQQMTFTVEQTTSDGRSIVPRLTWTTTPAATSCLASGAPNWSLEKQAQGTNILPAITATASYSLKCIWPGSDTATVAWVAPTTNVGGTAYTNPGGYRILYGRSATALDQSTYIQDPAARSWKSGVLAAGDWWFSVRAFNENGLESDSFAPPRKKTVVASFEKTMALTVVVVFPNPPTDVTVQ